MIVLYTHQPQEVGEEREDEVLRLAPRGVRLGQELRGRLAFGGREGARARGGEGERGRGRGGEGKEANRPNQGTEQNRTE